MNNQLSKTNSKIRNWKLFCACRFILLISVFLLFSSVAFSDENVCSFCGEVGVPDLAMCCPECGTIMVKSNLQKNLQSQTTLRVKLYYTGSDPKNLPNYGKLYINGVYKGNIDLIEKQYISDKVAQVWENGLGQNFSAYYEKLTESIQAGISKVEIEMKFDRFYGLGRSYKRIIFQYVNFKNGKETLIEHSFKSPATFNHMKEVKDKPPIPIISDAKIQGSNGNIAVNIPLFE